MAVQTGETIVGSQEKDFDNLAILQGIGEAVRALDTKKRDDILSQIAELELPAYAVPEGEVIEVVPFGKSREIPLDLEVFDPDDESWEEVSAGSSMYDQHVQKRRMFEPFFLGHSVEAVGGEFYVYNQDRTARICATRNARFYPVLADQDRRYI
jgi:hypothetical protein